MSTDLTRPLTALATIPQIQLGGSKHSINEIFDALKVIHNHFSAGALSERQQPSLFRDLEEKSSQVTSRRAFQNTFLILNKRLFPETQPEVTYGLNGSTTKNYFYTKPQQSSDQDSNITADLQEFRSYRKIHFDQMPQIAGATDVADWVLENSAKLKEWIRNFVPADVTQALQNRISNLAFDQAALDWLAEEDAKRPRLASSTVGQAAPRRASQKALGS